ncbi:hypothetical protein [Shimia sediminis]|uniref:hypothetical protein n=1 Tax=Shimia sediminis TaxID=2497945 RepID=UPI000F8DE702|nr:hypothetical protein [Shimia sediminis]
MSVVACIVTDQYALMAGDGVCSDPDDGCVKGYISKLTLMPEYDCIMGITGVGGFNYVLQWNMPGSVNEFDDLLDVLPDLVLTTHIHMKNQGMYMFDDAKTNVVVAGFSRRAGTYKAYRCMTYEKEAWNTETGEITKLKPWELHELPDGMWASAGPPKETLERFGLLDGNGKDDVEILTRMICAGRNDSGKTNQDGMPVPFNAGGYIQLALFQNGMMNSWVAHRWPEDVIGEPIDPERGDPLPSNLMEKDA